MDVPPPPRPPDTVHLFLAANSPARACGDRTGPATLYREGVTCRACLEANAVTAQAKPLLVGELNPYGSPPSYDLFPRPRGCAGWRLRSILRLEERDYLRAFDRRNLCRGKWSTKSARAEAALILATDVEVLVLLGAKVCAAFGVPFEPFTRQWRGFSYSSSLDGRTFIAGARDAEVFIIPHPSGRSRLWNVSGADDRARELLRPLL